MRIFWIIFLCTLSFGLRAESLNSTKQPLYWLVQKVHVKANLTQQYETNIKDLVHSLQKQNNSCSPFNWFAFVSPDKALYTYVTPVMDFNHLQSIYKAMAQESSHLSQLHKSISGEVNSWEVCLLMPLNHLSYQPNQSSCVQAYNVIENLGVTPGQEASFEDTLTRWVKASTSAGSSSGWTVFATIIGPDLPNYSIVYNGSSFDDFKSQFNAMSGCGGKSDLLSGKGFGMIRSYSWSSNVHVPDLSNINAPSYRKSLEQMQH